MTAGADLRSEVVYTVDEEGRITSVNEEWDRFAIENGSPDGRSVRVTNTVVSEAPRGISAASEKPGEFLRVCSWCNRVSVDGEWLEFERAVEALRLLHGPYHPLLTHGLCEACADALEAAD